MGIFIIIEYLIFFFYFLHFKKECPLFIIS